VPCFSGSCSEVYKEKAFDNTGYRPNKTLSNAIELGATSLMFLVHPTLKQAEIDKCSIAFSQVMERASKRNNQ
jgi:dTDP-4-amino-4,6-dideoxygalactose transaminase